MRLTRRGFLIGGSATVAVAGITGAALAQRPQGFGRATPIPVTAESISHFSPSRPDRSRFGALIFRSGLNLKSPVSGFGGFSALWRSGNGRELLAIADNAHYLKARIEMSGGRLSSLSDVAMAPLLFSNGKPLRGSRYYDTESLAVSGNAAFIGVERHHAVIRFGRDGDEVPVKGVPIPVPEELKDLPKNKGLEAIGVAPRQSPLSGSLVAVAEHARDGSDAPTRGFILTGAKKGAFDVVRSNDYDISDLAFLPNGDALLLERRFSLFGGFACRMRRVDGAAIRPGARVDGAVIFESGGSDEIDNMEGLSVHREGGETILTLISDNNFNPSLQRTLLLEFALAG